LSVFIVTSFGFRQRRIPGWGPSGNAPKLMTNSVKYVPSDGFLWHSDITKLTSATGSALDPAGGAYDDPSRPLDG